MTRDRKLAALHAALDQAAYDRGRLDPHYSYFERLLNAACSDDHLLDDLYSRVQRDHGFKT